MVLIQQNVTPAVVQNATNTSTEAENTHIVPTETIPEPVPIQPQTISNVNETSMHPQLISDEKKTNYTPHLIFISSIILISLSVIGIMRFIDGMRRRPPKN